MKPTTRSRVFFVVGASILLAILIATLWYQYRANVILDDLRSRVSTLKTWFFSDPQRAQLELGLFLESESFQRLTATYWEGDDLVSPRIASATFDPNVGAFLELDRFLQQVGTKQTTSNTLLLGFLVAVIFMLTATVMWTEFRMQSERAELRLRDSLQTQLLEAVERERSLLAWDLHDSVVQKLGFLKQQLTEAPEGSLPVALSSLVGEAIRDARQLSQTLAPVGEKSAPLTDRLNELFGEFRRGSVTRLEVVSTGLSEVPLESPAAAHLFRMVQELLANARKHSGANSIRLVLQCLPPIVRVLYEDDGRGLPASKDTDAAGLKSLSFRTSLLNGSLTFSPSVLGGLAVSIEVPYGPPARG